ncbi:hypothetical protein K438DRAFT_2115650 [Mycena galopus ATCC 62051]|nr:hypothetical protein K438DRAFT_2115650 [Mycena galopus ATCC 62051]
MLRPLLHISTLTPFLFLQPAIPYFCPCLAYSIMVTAVQCTSFTSLAPEIVTEIWRDLPRRSKTGLLSVSKYWYKLATDIPYLWTDLVFGPAGESTDLPVVSNWLQRSKGLPLSVTIARDPTKFEHSLDGKLITLSEISSILAPQSNSIRTLCLSGPSTNADWIHLFLTSHSFHLLDSVNITLERHWMTIIHEDHSITSMLTRHPTIFYHLDLPALRCLHVSNFTSFWPISSLHLTEVVFGPFMHDSVPSLLQLKQVLESASSLERLGFYQEIPGLDRSDSEQPDGNTAEVSIVLPCLTSLSLRHIPPTSFRPLLSMLEVPKFSNLTIALGNREADLHAQETASILLEQLSVPSVASKVETLTIQSLCQPCGPAFFASFTDLKTLQLDFSYGALPQEYWTALVDPVTGGPQCLPALLNLTLVAVSPIHVQELVYLRQLAHQPTLQSLQLLLPENEAFEAQSPRWSAWLRANVENLLIVGFIDTPLRPRTRGAFEV